MWIHEIIHKISSSKCSLISYYLLDAIYIQRLGVCNSMISFTIYQTDLRDNVKNFNVLVVAIIVNDMWYQGNK